MERTGFGFNYPVRKKKSLKFHPDNNTLPANLFNWFCDGLLLLRPWATIRNIYCTVLISSVDLKLWKCEVSPLFSSVCQPYAIHRRCSVDINLPSHFAVSNLTASLLKQCSKIDYSCFPCIITKVIFQAQQRPNVPLFVSLATQVQSSASEFSGTQMGHIFPKGKSIGESAPQYSKHRKEVKEFSKSFELCATSGGRTGGTLLKSIKLRLHA